MKRMRAVVLVVVAVMLWVVSLYPATAQDGCDSIPVLSPGQSTTLGQLTLRLDENLNLTGQTGNPEAAYVAFFLGDPEALCSNLLGQFPVILPVLDGQFSIALLDLGDIPEYYGPLPGIRELISEGSFYLYVDIRRGNFTSFLGGPVLLDLIGTARAQETTQQILEPVNELIDAGVLNQGQGNGAIALLEAALQQLDQGNSTAAIHQLQTFIRQVNRFIDQGVLTAVQGQPLIDAAQEAIDALGG